MQLQNLVACLDQPKPVNYWTLGSYKKNDVKKFY